MAIGAKKNETRHWPTKHRGLLAIHAAKKWNRQIVMMCSHEPFYTTLYDLNEILPFGAIVAVGYLEDCALITQENMPIGNEYQFGDYTLGRFMWKFRDVIKLPEPIPYRGAQGLFNISDDITDELIKKVARNVQKQRGCY